LARDLKTAQQVPVFLQAKASTVISMLSLLSSFPSLVINAPVVQPTGLVVQQMRQVQSPALAQPLTGAAIFPTSLQADLLDDEAAAFAAKNAKLRAAVC
jgi:hypothetical protein